MTFLRQSLRRISVGGPDEDYTSDQIVCVDPRTGREVGTAVVVEQIGRAALSMVYKAYFTSGEAEGLVAAVKILTTGYSSTLDRVEQVLNRLYDREVASLSQMEHANVIRLFGVGEAVKFSRPHKCIFMEYMPGGDARTLLDQAMRPMDETAAGSIVLPVTRALCAAHSKGIVHRDVKAGNCLLAPGVGQVQLADWGIAVFEAESAARPSSDGKRGQPGAIGTEYWAAPEVEQGLPHGCPADIFSLAVTFIELVTGKDPRYDNTPEGWAVLHLPESGFIPDFLSPEAVGWLSACLRATPADRPTAQQLLEHPFFVATAERMAEEARQAEASLGESESEGGLLQTAGAASAAPGTFSTVPDAAAVASDPYASRPVTGGSMRAAPAAVAPDPYASRPVTGGSIKAVATADPYASKPITAGSIKAGAADPYTSRPVTGGSVQAASGRSSAGVMLTSASEWQAEQASKHRGWSDAGGPALAPFGAPAERLSPYKKQQQEREKQQHAGGIGGGAATANATAAAQVAAAPAGKGGKAEGQEKQQQQPGAGVVSSGGKERRTQEGQPPACGCIIS